MHGTLLILAFLLKGGGGGGGGDKKKLPKAAPGRSVVRLKTDYDAALRFMWRVLLSGWNSPPQKLDGRPHQTWIFALWRAPVISKLKRQEKAKFVLPRKSGKIS